MSANNKYKLLGNAKFIFMHRLKSTTYMIIMLEDGRVYLDNFSRHRFIYKADDSVKNVKNIVHSDVEKFSNRYIMRCMEIFKQYNITSHTYIVYSTGRQFFKDSSRRDDILFNILKFISACNLCKVVFTPFTNVLISTAVRAEVEKLLFKNPEKFDGVKYVPVENLRKIRAYLKNRDSSRSSVMHIYIERIYDALYQKKVCHWINDDFLMLISTLPKSIQLQLKIMSIGLYNICLQKWHERQIYYFCSVEQREKNHMHDQIAKEIAKKSNYEIDFLDEGIPIEECDSLPLLDESDYAEFELRDNTAAENEILTDEEIDNMLKLSDIPDEQEIEEESFDIDNLGEEELASAEIVNMYGREKEIALQAQKEIDMQLAEFNNIIQEKVYKNIRRSAIVTR